MLTVAVLRGYQRWLSPHTPGCPGRPSCSQYAVDAVRMHGVRVGIDLAHARLTACHRG